MTTVPAAVPPPRQEPATPPQSAAAGQDHRMVPVLQASGSAVSSPPQPVVPRSAPTTPTSGTRATPAATLPLTLRRAPSLSEKSRMTSVN